MFREKYRADNEKIKPDKALLKYLSVRMKDAAVSEVKPEAGQTQKRRALRAFVAVAACFALLFGGGLYVYFDTRNDKPSLSEKITEVKTSVSYADLYELVKSMEPKNEIGDVFDEFFGGMRKSAVNAADQAALPGAAQGESESSNSKTQDYSKTNIQVEGVDEADIVKTDGKYIYTLTGDKLNIVRVQGAQMQKTATVDCSAFAGSDDKSYPVEMYVNGDRLAVIKNVYRVDDQNADGYRKEMYAYDLMIKTGITSMAVYDISDRSNPVLLGDPGQSGGYLSSRMVGKTLYLITNHTIYEKAKKSQPETYIPQLYDGGKGRVMDAADITIGIQPQQRQYVVVTAINVDKPAQRISSKTVYGCGSTLYANAENLLIASALNRQVKATSDNEQTSSDSAATAAGKASAAVAAGSEADQKGAEQSSPGSVPDGDGKGTQTTGGKTTATTYTTATNLMRFSLDNGKIELAATGSVPGTLLNQFSMDEYKDIFRVVTTASEYTETRSGDIVDGTVSVGMNGGTTNALYTLNQKLEIIGRIENVAQGERVYSVRFSGDIGYFVTFRQVDPLFAVDLSNPEMPKILSYLKIPGFSDYLHPYASGLLFGLGHDADQNGAVNGLKLSMFDVSDPTDVSEKHKLVLKDAYWSEASYNHKAIVVSPDRNLIAFPCDSRYLVFEFSDDTGFTRVGEIFNDASYNQRGLYIANVFYVCSNNAISAYSMNGYVKLATLNL